MGGAAAVAAALLAITTANVPEPVSVYNPSFDAAALTSHDPWAGWHTNPDNMPIGNGRVVALVWGDGNHANTSGVGLLLARDDAYTELNQLVKLGRLRVTLDPDPFAGAARGGGGGAAYSQTLDLTSGEVVITAPDGSGHRVDLRVSASPGGADAVVVELVSSTVPVVVTVHLELWRVTGPFPVIKSGRSSFSTNSVRGICPNDIENRTGAPVSVRADTVANTTDELQWWYRNTDSPVWASTLINQLQDEGEAIVNSTQDPLLHRTFGAVVRGDTSDGTAWRTDPAPCLPHCCSAHAAGDAGASSSACGARSLRTTTAVTTARVLVATHQNITDTAAEWQKQADAAATAASGLATASGAEAARALRAAWWSEFWSRSFVTVGGSGAADRAVGAGADSANQTTFLLNQNYRLFRYVQRIQGNGSTAIHFNGGIIDWGATGVPNTPRGVPDHSSPDYRMWGSGFWFQNVRMAYYPNLHDADFDELEGLFRHYTRTLPVQEARCRSWWNHSGAFFAETTYWWGSYTPNDYGCGRVKQKDVTNPYMWHHIEGGIELAQMMLRHWHFTRDERVLSEHTLPWTDAVLTFYDLHFPRLPNGTMLLLNAKACETYNHCTNPAPQVAGLRVVVSGLLRDIPASLLGPTRVALLSRLERALPDLPLMQSCHAEHSGCGNNCGKCSSPSTRAPPGTIQVAPCFINVGSVRDAAHAVGGYPSSNETVNHEAVETYTIWPYEMRELYTNGSKLGENTQTYRRYGGSNTAWDYNAGLVPAVLGGQANAAQAFAATLQRVTTTFDGSKFPGYALSGCCEDGAPQMENTGIVRHTLQRQLLAYDNPGAGSSIYLLPAWLQGQDVSFSLRAPMQTTVEASYAGGKITALNVTPPSRRADIVMPDWMQQH